MKIFFLGIFLTGLLLLGCTTCAFAQDKDKKSIFALPKDATMEQTQEWLARTITQNGEYGYKKGTSSDAMDPKSKLDVHTNLKLSELKFNGCEISYTVNSIEQAVKTGRMTTSPMQMATHNSLKVRFNLKDINLDEVTVQPTGEDTHTSVISMRTTDYKRSIALKDTETGVANVSAATIVISENIADDTRDAFAHLIGLCQAN